MGIIVSNIRRETSRHFRIKKREYMKDKIDELAKNSKGTGLNWLRIGTSGRLL
jgi:hypothetical protein